MFDHFVAVLMVCAGVDCLLFLDTFHNFPTIRICFCYVVHSGLCDVLMNSESDFAVIKPCSFVRVYRRFGGYFYTTKVEAVFIRNISNELSYCTE
jgi:hypothetical protein